jgi:hypothetical protein
MKLIHVFMVTSMVCVLAGWAMTYKRFDDRMQMAKTNAHFVGAVRVAKDHTSAEAAPLSASQWASNFNQGSSDAPNGGPAFIVNNNGNRTTGAVGVAVDNFGTRVLVIRPEYLTLSAQRAVIQDGNVDVSSVKRRRQR